MDLVFIPAEISFVNLIIALATIAANGFLVLWSFGIFRDAKGFKHKLLILTTSTFILFYSILYAILPGVGYVPGPEFVAMDLITGYIYTLLRYTLLTDALWVILGMVFIAFGRDNDENYRMFLIFAGVFIIAGSILSSINAGTLIFLEWTGSPESVGYLANIFPLLDLVSNMLLDTRFFFFLYIGIRARQYPLLVFGVIALSVLAILLILTLSIILVVEVVVSFFVFVLSVILIFVSNSRNQRAESEVL